SDPAVFLCREVNQTAPEIMRPGVVVTDKDADTLPAKGRAGMDEVLANARPIHIRCPIPIPRRRACPRSGRESDGRAVVGVDKHAAEAVTHCCLATDVDAAHAIGDSERPYA